MKKAYWIISISILFLGCDKSPYDRTAGGPTLTTGGGGSAPSGSLVIFKNELLTGGAFVYPGPESQSLSFNDGSNPVSRDSIRYSWTGGDVSGCGLEHVFAGFDLMHTANFLDYSLAPGRNLSGAGYTQVTFFARGSLSANTVIKVEVAGSGAPACGTPPPIPCVTLSMDGTGDDQTNPCGNKKQLTADWQPYAISVPSRFLVNVKDLFKATYVFNSGGAAGQGGTVYFDVIQYQP